MAICKLSSLSQGSYPLILANVLFDRFRPLHSCRQVQSTRVPACASPILLLHMLELHHQLIGPPLKPLQAKRQVCRTTQQCIT